MAEESDVKWICVIYLMGTIKCQNVPPCFLCFERRLD